MDFAILTIHDPLIPLESMNELIRANNNTLHFAKKATIPAFAFKESQWSYDILPYAFGCGFFYKANKQRYFITTAHLVSAIEDSDEEYDDLHVGLDTQILVDNKPEIIGMLEEKYLCSFNYNEDIEVAAIPNVFDVAVCKLPICDVSYEYIEKERFDKTKHGVIEFDQESIADFQVSGNYYFAAFIHNRINKRNQLESDKVFFQGLKIKNMNSSEVCLECNHPDLIDNLKGISGAPIIDNNKKLCGMIIRANWNDKTFWAISIKRIIKRFPKLEEVSDE